MNKFIIIIFVLFFMKQEYISMEDIVQYVSGLVTDVRNKSPMIDDTFQTLETTSEVIKQLEYDEIEPMNYFEDFKNGKPKKKILTP